MTIAQHEDVVNSRLTLIITTSSVPSAPSTELLSEVLASIAQHCPTLLRCKVVVVIDTYDRITDEPRLKKGCVTLEGAGKFEAYRGNVKRLFLHTFCASDAGDFQSSPAEAEFGSPFKEENSVPLMVSRTGDERFTFIEPEARIGFSLAVRAALRVVTTPYVWVHQHDWTLQCAIPVAGMLEVMASHDGNPEVPVKYICLPSIRLLDYANQSETVRYPAFRKRVVGIGRNKARHRTGFVIAALGNN